MDELFEQFLIEGRELIARGTEDLLALEAGADAAARIDSAFRAVHTLKGSVAIFDLAPMAAMLHAAEDLLGAARGRGGALGSEAIRALLACLDRCDQWVDALEGSGVLPPDAPREAVRIANQLAACDGADAGASMAGERGDRPAWVDALLARHADAVSAAPSELVVLRYTPREDCFFSGDDPLALAAAIPGLVALAVGPREPWPTLADFDPYRCNLEIEAISSAPATELRQLFRFLPDQVEIVDVARRVGEAVAAPATGDSVDAGSRTIRVDAAQIDRLLDLIGELVVAKNKFAHLAAEAERGAEPAVLAGAIRAAGATTDRLVAGMHDAVMEVRLVPLTRVFRRLSRMVRDISARLGRDLDLVVTGEETRIDKALADSLFEPLLHVVRNAIDHGAESADARRAAGKPERARLTIAARNTADQIMIEIADDGAGIDADRVRRVAVERGIVDLAAADALDAAAAIQLIFAPGFSTAAEVTEISGRGVGMDAVKAAAERFGGRVSVASRRGEGTAVTLRLPATAALTTILIVGCGGDRFAIPFDVVAETIRIRREQVKPVGVAHAFVLRHRTIPLLSLADLLGLPAEDQAVDLKILVVDTGNGPIGIAVEEFGERIDVMLRPMTGLLANMPGVSGTTLLGDGSVLLVLDLGEVIG
ncbi:chemotaxis protein CheA [Allosphingosinicella deserti]|uniref:Chemotaxis protein CheA n=1 Tax=Allosphingosinicella deserti TaxID=2116704 RepID=A0A2P7QYL1_9SPHN|nr:chemotaxis protein CheA [Sphingomonas deserti]PSJ43062.1 chemotaxis protein CheA [Sphingomonas deserti]